MSKGAADKTGGLIPPNSNLPESATVQVSPFLHLLELLPVAGVIFKLTEQ